MVLIVWRILASFLPGCWAVFVIPDVLQEVSSTLLNPYGYKNTQLGVFQLSTSMSLVGYTITTTTIRRLVVVVVVVHY